MSVADSIAEALQRFGRPMTLRRPGAGPGGANLDVSVFGHSRSYLPQELADSISGSPSITISNAEIAAASWPGPPQRKDIIVVDGRERTVRDVEPKYLGSTVLVYVCFLLGPGTPK